MTIHTNSTTRVYCTIFNSAYLIRGLALHASLARHEKNFRLYVFAMDDLTARLLRQMKDSRVVVVVPNEFEDRSLLSVKPSRTIAEYFWTCTPHIIRYCLVTCGEKECTYVDADVWLMGSPSELFTEMGNASILLTDHRYTPRHDQSQTNGKYCVQFMRFVNDAAGMKALNWWCDRCIEWCHARHEDGKFGDQGYLSDWPTRFDGVHVLRHRGGGVAPWNVERFKFGKNDGRVELREGEEPWEPVIFYHFHGMRSYTEQIICFGYGYSLSRTVKSWIYAEYARELATIFENWKAQLTGLSANGIAPGASNDGGQLRMLLKRLWGFRNTYSLSKLPSHG